MCAQVSSLCFTLLIVLMDKPHPSASSCALRWIQGIILSYDFMQVSNDDELPILTRQMQPEPKTDPSVSHSLCFVRLLR